jgi:hypothetical protein
MSEHWCPCRTLKYACPNSIPHICATTPHSTRPYRRASCFDFIPETQLQAITGCGLSLSYVKRVHSDHPTDTHTPMPRFKFLVISTNACIGCTAWLPQAQLVVPRYEFQLINLCCTSHASPSRTHLTLFGVHATNSTCP